jgi:hypothetical protein
VAFLFEGVARQAEEEEEEVYKEPIKGRKRVAVATGCATGQASCLFTTEPP